MAKLLIPLILLILVAASAHAELVINKYSNDFTASTPDNEQLKVCGCENRVDKILVENTGHFAASFHVATASSYGTIRVSEEDFSLQPGEFKEVLAYIENTCGRSGTYDYEVIITNSYGREHRISRSIRIDACQTTQLDVQPDATTSRLCQPAVFSVNVTNIGTFADTFTLDFGQYNDIAKLPNKAVYLEPAESYLQDVSFAFACSDFGTKSIPITIITGKNGAGASTTRDVTITNQYNFALSLPTSILVCAKSETNVPVTLSNSADASDDVVLSTDADFVSVTRDVHLGALQEKNTTLSINAQTPGNYTVTVTARDTIGNVVKERTTEIRALNCYVPAAEMRSSPEIALTEPVTTCCGPKTFYVNVRNDGDRTQSFQLEVDGPSIFTLDETTITLEPKQNMNVPLRVALPCTEQEYNARVLVTPIGQPSAQVSTSITINSQTQRTCHQLEIENDEIIVTDDQQEVVLSVRSTGSQPGTYAVRLNSSLFSVAEEQITLNPGEEKQITLIPTANLRLREEGRYIIQPTFTYDGIAYNEAVGIELQHKEVSQTWSTGFSLAALDWCGWLALWLLLLVLLALTVLLLIYTGVIPPLETQRGTLTFTKTALLIIIVVLLVAIAMLQRPGIEQLYEHPISNDNATLIEVYEGTSRSIDMGQYFIDPDDGTLQYAATQPRDASATVRGSTLTLKPDKYFAEDQTFRITATDSSGQSATSPDFTLRVIPKKQLTFSQRLQLWCPHVVLFELAALGLLLFLIVLTFREDRRYKNVLVVVDREEVERTRKAQRKSTRKTASTEKAATAQATALTAAPARGSQVETKTIVREYKASGQTVNIAVGVPQPSRAIATVVGKDVVYIGSKGSDKVHTPTCPIARRIPRGRRVAYNSKREAVKAGLVPCRTCQPFEGGI
jgi:PKD repeat protein